MDPLQPGDPRTVGPYVLSGRLGAGGMGQVFFGRSPGGRPVAVKLVLPGHAADPEFRRRFAHEVQAAKRVGGFYTAQVVDADPAADPPWLVTAYIPGPSLHEAVREHGPLPEQTVRALGAGLAEGLAAIHACGLVHRDLKPGNVLLATDGPRVIDFGIARALDGSALTAHGAVMGTFAFMSPEQARGEPAGPASDVFALGAVLAFAATGTSPFAAGSIPAIVHRVISQDPDLAGLPVSLRPLVAACLAKDPAARPTVADVLGRLAGAAHPAGDWLPPPVTAMVTERAVPTIPRASAAPTRPAPGSKIKLSSATGAADTVGTTSSNAAPSDLLHSSRSAQVSPNSRSDAVQDHGVEFVQPALRNLFSRSILSAVLILGGLPTAVGVLHLLDRPAPEWLLISSVIAAAIMFCIVVGVLLTGSPRLVIDHAGLTMFYRNQNPWNYPWSELRSVEIRRFRGLTSGTWIAAKPKSSSVLLANELMRAQSKSGYLLVVDIRSLRGASEHTLKVALAHYSGGLYQADPPGP